MKSLRYCVCVFMIGIVIFISCLVQMCVLFLCLVCFKFALMVFDEMPQICMGEENMCMSENLTMVVANQTLFSIQQMVPSQMVRLFNLENLYNRIVCPKAKESICNWRDLKIVLPKSCIICGRILLGCFD